MRRGAVYGQRWNGRRGQSVSEERLEAVRRAFARRVMARAGVTGNARLEAAFRAVPRERFLGPPPWTIIEVGGPSLLPISDPADAYRDELFALAPGRGVNNGVPSLHARMLDALCPGPGHEVVHLGAGTGYYAALLAELVGPRGHVAAVEIDPVLGRIARGALRDRPNVALNVGDAAAWPRDDADRVYVNFAVTAPLAPWVERLAPAGRLVLPLGVPGEPTRPTGPRFAHHGAAFLIARQGGGFAASLVCPAYFVHAEGGAAAIDGATLDRLRRAFRSGNAASIKSLVWRRPARADRCWFCSPDWSLSYDPV